MKKILNKIGCNNCSQIFDKAKNGKCPNCNSSNIYVGNFVIEEEANVLDLIDDYKHIRRRLIALAGTETYVKIQFDEATKSEKLVLVNEDVIETSDRIFKVSIKNVHFLPNNAVFTIETPINLSIRGNTFPIDTVYSF